MLKLMQTESISGKRREVENGSHAARNGPLKDVFLEREFLLDQFSLRAQFDWNVARRSIDHQVQGEETDTAIPTIFRSPSERIFTRDGVIDFLGQLRKKAAGRLHTRHASTPQIVVYRRGHHRWIEQDTSIAPWRYMYFMGPRGDRISMPVIIQTREAILEWFPWLTRTITSRVLMGSNDLIMYRSTAVQSVLCHSDSFELKDQTIVLSGWLW